MQNPVILIKIGGSLITDKKKPCALKKRELDIIAQEVKRAQSIGKLLIIGHGAGSFGHIPAKKFETHRGLIRDDSLEGFSRVSLGVGELNVLVMQALLEQGVWASAFNPRSMMVAKNHQLHSIFTTSLEQALNIGILPLVYGDQIVDLESGCTVFSTEKVLGHLALALQTKGYQIERMIHCGQTNGVYDENGETIELINEQNLHQYLPTLGKSGGIDVTGGMLHKVEETLELARQGIPGLIIDGIEHGSLFEAISGKPVLGTRIEVA
jgi:isopentenyl phosphate kinase